MLVCLYKDSGAVARISPVLFTFSLFLFVVILLFALSTSLHCESISSVLPLLLLVVVISVYLLCTDDYFGA